MMVSLRNGTLRSEDISSVFVLGSEVIGCECALKLVHKSGIVIAMPYDTREMAFSDMEKVVHGMMVDG